MFSGVKNWNKFLLENLFFLACLFPFVSPYTIDTDVQPPAGLIAFFILARKPTFTKQEWLYLVVALCSVLYINPLYDFSGVSGGIAFMLAYGIIVMLACRRTLHYFSPRLFNFVIIVYFVFTVLTIIWPEQFLHFQSLIVRSVNVSSLNGPRGVSVFATEPGLLAGLLVAFLLINDYFLLSKQLSKKQWGCNFMLILMVLLATKSGTAVLFFSAYLAFKCRSSNFLLLFLFVIILIILLYGLFPTLYDNYYFMQNNRGFELFYKFLFHPDKLLLDTSIFQRIYSIIISSYSIFNHPFGVGYNAGSYMVKEVISSVSFLSDFSNFQECFKVTGCYTNSSFTNIIVIYGLFGIFFLFFIYFSEKVSFKHKFFSFLFLLASYSAAFPMTWLLLCLRDNVRVWK